MACATFLLERGNSVPPLKLSGPSAGRKPARGVGLLSMPISVIGLASIVVSQTTAVTARLTVRVRKGFLRSAFFCALKISPTVSKSEPSRACGAVPTSRWSSSAVGMSRGRCSPGAT